MDRGAIVAMLAQRARSANGAARAGATSLCSGDRMSNESNENPVAPGGRNAVNVSCSLYVVTDYLPEQAREGGDVFTLKATKPAYSKSIDIKDGKEHFIYVALLFEDLDPSGRYTLEVTFKDGVKSTLFEDVPYKSLSRKTDGLGPTTPNSLPKQDNGAEVKPRAYLGAAAVKDLRTARVVVGRYYRRLAPLAPEFPTHEEDITGRYEDADGAMTIAVNQAGKHVECWISFVIPPRSENQPTYVQGHKNSFTMRPVYPVSGDAAGDGFDLYDAEQDAEGKPKDQKKPQGKLRGKGGALELEWFEPKLKVQLVCNSPFEPTLSEYALRSSGVELLWKSQWTPLTRKQLADLEEALNKAKLERLFQQFVTVHPIAGKSQEARSQAARDLDYHFQSVFSEARWHETDMALIVLQARFLLSHWVFKGSNQPRSYLAFVEVMAREAYKLTPGLDRLLGSRVGGAEKHYYKFTLDNVGIGGGIKWIGGGAYGGDVTVSKVKSLDEKDKSPPIWEQKFPIRLFFATVGISKDKWIPITIATFNNGKATSDVEWGPLDFVGPFALMGGEGGATVGPGASYGIEEMQLFGSGELQPMRVDTGGDSYDVTVGGKEVGAKMKIGGGWIKPPERRIEPKVLAAQIDVRHEVAVTQKAEKAVHFDFGSSLLTEEGRQAVRVACAKELAQLITPGGTLAVTGHADSVDTDERNEVLSEYRAKNTVQAIKDVLGPLLAFKDDEIETAWHGEKVARGTGKLPDKVKAPEWRRVDVVLNNRLVLVLQAEGIDPAKAPAFKRLPGHRQP
jgi:outer membrane protein OmpA-like peptidoglycan-associated protein